MGGENINSPPMVVAGAVSYTHLCSLQTIWIDVPPGHCASGRAAFALLYPGWCTGREPRPGKMCHRVPLTQIRIAQSGAWSFLTMRSIARGCRSPLGECKESKDQHFPDAHQRAKKGSKDLDLQIIRWYNYLSLIHILVLL